MQSSGMLSLESPSLALNGGRPTTRRKWPENLTTGFRERLVANKAIRSGLLSLFEGSFSPDTPFSFLGGPEVRKLEEDWSEFYGVEHSISVNSATSGLYASIGALGIGYGDEVIVSPYTMSACAMAPLIYGAIPVFADVLPETGCLDPKSIEQKVSPRTKAIIVVHQFGFPAPMKEILRIARNHGLRVIEDCAQAHGLEIDGRFAGTIGDIGVFSLNVNKTIQSGEGGVCVTSDLDLAYRLQLIRNHGEAVVEAANYREILNIAGFNFRMTEVTAAISRSQLRRLPALNQKRLEMAADFHKRVKKFEFLAPMGSTHYESSENSIPKGVYYLFTMTFNSLLAGISREEFLAALRMEGIPLGAGYVRPLYLQPVYQNRMLFKRGYPFEAPANAGTLQLYEKGTCPIAENLHYEGLISSEHIRPPRGNKGFGKKFEAAISKMVARAEF